VATADGNEAVIAAGLQPGIEIVSAGVHVLAPGQKVTVWKERTSSVLPEVAAEPPAHGAVGAAQAATLPMKR
jgi:hypothetical protein